MEAFVGARIESALLAVGVAVTTETCRAAQVAQALSSTSAVALGRLLTAAALAGHVQEQAGALSLQVVGSGRLGHVFADVTAEGDLRGYIKNPSLAFPVGRDEAIRGRRLVGPGIGEGSLAVIRLGEGAAFTQSTTELVSGDIDLDVEHYLSSSAQIATCLACDVVLDEQNRVVRAGGFIAQALPGGDRQRLSELRSAIHDGKLALLLDEAGDDPLRLLAAIAPDAEPVGERKALRWRCRCSPERVRSALAVLDIAELADMIDKNETSDVRCQFCGKTYVIGPDELKAVYAERTQGSPHTN